MNHLPIHYAKHSSADVHNVVYIVPGDPSRCAFITLCRMRSKGLSDQVIGRSVNMYLLWPENPCSILIAFFAPLIEEMWGQSLSLKINVDPSLAHVACTLVGGFGPN